MLRGKKERSVISFEKRRGTSLLLANKLDERQVRLRLFVAVRLVRRIFSLLSALKKRHVTSLLLADELDERQVCLRLFVAVRLVRRLFSLLTALKKRHGDIVAPRR